MACAPRADSDQPGHAPSLTRIFAVRLALKTISKVYAMSMRTAKTLTRLGRCHLACSDMSRLNNAFHENKTIKISACINFVLVIGYKDISNGF